MRALLATLLIVLPLSATDELAYKIVDFNGPYQRFARAYFGCPAEGYMEESDCRPALGRMDYKAWERARKEAMRLFDLREK